MKNNNISMREKFALSTLNKRRSVGKSLISVALCVMFVGCSSTKNTPIPELTNGKWIVVLDVSGSVFTSGKSIRWENYLPWVDQEIGKLGKYGPSNYGEITVVTLAKSAQMMLRQEKFYRYKKGSQVAAPRDMTLLSVLLRKVYNKQILESRKWIGKKNSETGTDIDGLIIHLEEMSSIGGEPLRIVYLTDGGYEHVERANEKIQKLMKVSMSKNVSKFDVIGVTPLHTKFWNENKVNSKVAPDKLWVRSNDELLGKPR